MSLPGEASPARSPSGFRELKRYFERRSDLARAVGVKRDTIAAWDRGTLRLRASSVERVSLLLAVCQRAEPRMRSAHAVGRWVVTEQPSLDGDSPAAIVRNLGGAALDVLRQAIEGPAPAPPQEFDEQSRAALEEALSPAMRAALRAALSSAESTRPIA